MKLIALYCTFKYVSPVLPCFSLPKEGCHLINPVTMAYQKGGVLISGIVMYFFFKINCFQEYIQLPFVATYYYEP